MVDVKVKRQKERKIFRHLCSIVFYQTFEKKHSLKQEIYFKMGFRGIHFLDFVSTRSPSPYFVDLCVSESPEVKVSRVKF